MFRAEVEQIVKSRRAAAGSTFGWLEVLTGCWDCGRMRREGGGIDDCSDYYCEYCPDYHFWVFGDMAVCHAQEQDTINEVLCYRRILVRLLLSR